MPLPLESLPNVVSDVPELSANLSLNPLFPKVSPDVSIGFHWPVVESVSAKLEGFNACPSIKVASAKYAFK